PALNPQSWLQPKQRQLPDVSPAEKAAIERHNADLARQIGALRQRLADLRRPYEQQLAAARLAALPEPIRAGPQAALPTPPDKRSEVQKYLAAKLGPALAVRPDEVAAALNGEDRATAAALDRQIATLTGQRRSHGHLQALYDVGPPTPTH